MNAADFIGAIKIGEGARDAQYAVVAAGGEPHRVGGFAQQRHPLASGRATSSSTAPDTAALLRTCGKPIAAYRATWRSRASATRSAISRLPSAGGGRIKSAAVTAGTSICRSMRSMSGPEMRAW